MSRSETSAQHVPRLAPGATDYDQSSSEHASRWRWQATPLVRRWLTAPLLRRWLTSPLVQGLLALAVYAAVWLPTIARPLVSHPSRAQLMQTSPDPNFYVWSLRWWPYALGHGLNPLYTHLVAAPAGHSLAWVTTVPTLGVLAAPLTLAAGPVVAFNLLTALALPLSAWAAFLVCRRLTGTFLPALVGGAVYGFSDYELRHLVAGQLNLCYALLPPLLAYLVLAWRDGAIRSWVLVVLAGLVMAAQFYLFLETFADLTVILVLSLVLGLAVANRGSRPKVLRLAGLLGIAYLVALVIAAPYLAAALSTASPKTPLGGSMDLTSLWLPTRGQPLGFAWLVQSQTGLHVASPGCSVGVPLLAVVVVLAATRWRSRLVWFLTGIFIVVVAGAVGPVLSINGRPEAVLPWHGLFSLPIVRNAYPTRLMLFAFLVLAMATALLLAGGTRDRQLHRWRTAGSVVGRWSLGALVVAFGVLNLPAFPIHGAPTTLPAFISSGAYRRFLTPGETVIVISNVGNAGMLWEAASGDSWRLAGGYINEGFDKRSGLPVGAQNLDAPTPARIKVFEGLIRADHIGAILVDSRHSRPWTGIFGIFGLTGHRDRGVVVYPTDGCRTCHAVTRAEVQAATFPS